MCEYKNGNYLWDSSNKTIIVYQPEIFVDGIGLAHPIRLNEDILELLGFNSRNAGYEDDKNHFIEIRGNCPESLLWFEGSPVTYLHELQNEFSNIGDCLNVDEKKLQNLLKKNNVNPIRNS